MATKTLSRGFVLSQSTIHLVLTVIRKWHGISETMRSTKGRSVITIHHQQKVIYGFSKASFLTTLSNLQGHLTYCNFERTCHKVVTHLGIAAANEDMFH